MPAHTRAAERRSIPGSYPDDADAPVSVKEEETQQGAWAIDHTIRRTRGKKRQRVDDDEHDGSRVTGEGASNGPHASTSTQEVVIVQPPRAARRSRVRSGYRLPWNDKRKARRADARVASTPLEDGVSLATLSSNTSAPPTPSTEVDMPHATGFASTSTTPLTTRGKRRQTTLHKGGSSRAEEGVAPLLSRNSEPSTIALEAELAELRKTLKDKDEVIERQHATLTSLHTALQCQVCLDLLQKPFVLVKCGHVCCQSCLDAWFRNSPQGDMPQVLAAAGVEDMRPLHLRKKTCPHCRAIVRSRPVPLYLVKSLTNIVAAPGVLSKTVDVPAQPAATATADFSTDDPWSAFFPPERRDGPIIDEEDGNILRCETCMHEIFDSICTHCGRIYEESDGGWGSDDGSHHWMDGQFSDESESESGSYGGSFIDDGPVDYMYDSHSHSDEDDGDDGGGIVMGPIFRLFDVHDGPDLSSDEGSIHIGQHVGHPIIVHSEDSAEEDDDEDGPIVTGRRRGRPIVVDSEEDEEDSEHDDEAAGLDDRPAFIVEHESELDEEREAASYDSEEVFYSDDDGRMEEDEDDGYDGYSSGGY